MVVFYLILAVLKHAIAGGLLIIGAALMR